jgi:hypothetical protein
MLAPDSWVVPDDVKERIFRVQPEGQLNILQTVVSTNPFTRSLRALTADLKVCATETATQHPRYDWRSAGL